MSHQTDQPDRRAVLLVDFQADFTEAHNGALAVAGTDMAYINTVITATEAFAAQGLPIYATQDWHPSSHMSFVTRHPGANLFDTIEINGRSQILWPVHCVQESAGADILMDDTRFAAIIRKGADPDFDSYSGFADDGGKKTELDTTLKQAGITELLIYGLATDFCVKFTVLDAIAAGYRVQLLLDLCRGVTPDAARAATIYMQEQGAVITKSAPLTTDVG